MTLQQPEAPCVLPGMLSLAHRTLAVAGCTGSRGEFHLLTGCHTQRPCTRLALQTTVPPVKWLLQTPQLLGRVQIQNGGGKLHAETLHPHSVRMPSASQGLSNVSFVFQDPSSLPY
ncbi:hypothetical protein J1605_005374 [Eschrichtius robustus]|uniref:Uncharacterized protein n=1 Tax=Eschrichtius robustus TaxID=9764 RepID=A0AB34H8Y2_ESCRO|nr:hypothetical protein J1605_005374 [Eschrichtius robustus]